MISPGLFSGHKSFQGNFLHKCFPASMFFLIVLTVLFYSGSDLLLGLVLFSRIWLRNLKKSQKIPEKY